MIKSEKDALHAMNLSRLLTNNWVDMPHCYKIVSKLREKDDRRLDEILKNNRYS